jgi:hypothetical protein
VSFDAFNGVLTDRYATAVVIEVSFGHQIVSKKDEYFNLCNDFVKYVIPILKPEGGALVEFFPSCKCIALYLQVTSRL